MEEVPGCSWKVNFPVWAQREVGEAEKETKTQQSEREVAYILFLAILYFQWRIFTAGVTAIFTQAASSIYNWTVDRFRRSEGR
jgi:hypothetical protein